VSPCISAIQHLRPLRGGGWEAFEPALSLAEEMDFETIWRSATDIPEEWYEGDRDGLHRLVEALYNRRSTIRRLIDAFR
jgi:hypothetical protein